MTTDQTKADRLALIHQIAEKRRHEAARKVRLAAIRKKTNSLKKSMAAQSPFAQQEKVKDKENELHWTDGSKYAKKYYGETLYETTRFDNDWGDY